MTATEYQRHLIRARSATNKHLGDADRLVLRSLRRAYRDLIDLMNLKGPEKLSYYVYANKKAGIERIARKIAMDLNVTIRLGVKASVRDTVDIFEDLAKDFAGERGYNPDWPEIFGSVPEIAVRNSISRVWPDGRKFSDRIWRLGEGAKSGINSVVSSGIARGESAVNMAKRLRQYMVDPEIIPETSWTAGARKSVSGRGTIHGNALRLARTEINNSYREATVQASNKNPIVKGLKWNLSASHPRPDICDVWAGVDAYGLGAGVYPPDRTPIDHPNGLCFVTEALRPAREWNQPRIDPPIRELSDTEILAPMRRVSGVKEWQKKAAVKMFKSTSRMIIENLRKAA